MVAAEIKTGAGEDRALLLRELQRARERRERRRLGRRLAGIGLMLAIVLLGAGWGRRLESPRAPDAGQRLEKEWIGARPELAALITERGS